MSFSSSVLLPSFSSTAELWRQWLQEWGNLDTGSDPGGALPSLCFSPAHLHLRASGPVLPDDGEGTLTAAGSQGCQAAY